MSDKYLQRYFDKINLLKKELTNLEMIEKIQEENYCNRLKDLWDNYKEIYGQHLFINEIIKEWIFSLRYNLLNNIYSKNKQLIIIKIIIEYHEMNRK